MELKPALGTNWKISLRDWLKEVLKVENRIKMKILSSRFLRRYKHPSEINQIYKWPFVIT